MFYKFIADDKVFYLSKKTLMSSQNFIVTKYLFGNSHIDLPYFIDQVDDTTFIFDLNPAVLDGIVETIRNKRDSSLGDVEFFVQDDQEKQFGGNVPIPRKSIFSKESSRVQLSTEDRFDPLDSLRNLGGDELLKLMKNVGRYSNSNNELSTSKNTLNNYPKTTGDNQQVSDQELTTLRSEDNQNIDTRDLRYLVNPILGKSSSTKATDIDSDNSRDRDNKKYVVRSRKYNLTTDTEKNE